MKDIYFFIGTEAEFIKLFPVILKAMEKGLSYHIIASGQNDITKSMIFKKTDCGKVDLELSYEKDIKKSAAGLLSWWIKTYMGSVKKIKQTFNERDLNGAIMVVHGDTVSTYMGARIGKKLKMKVCHVEAGLRSHHLFSPFPEEIDRLLTSRVARTHFAPGELPVRNLSKAKGKVVNTKQNTLIDSLRISETVAIENKDVENILNEDYFVFVMHRQENLASDKFIRSVVSEITEASKQKKCVIILHKITENAFIKLGLLEELKADPNIVMFPRVEYFDFMKLLKNAAYVITDGGSNQEELYYMGKTCLILRTATERQEGLGINARLFDGTPEDIGKFLKEIGEGKYKTEDMSEIKPSEIIVDELMKIG